MATLILYFGLLVNGVAALFLPWIGIALTYLAILLTPQNIWFWAFEGAQPVQWLALPTLLGTIAKLLQARSGLARLRTPIPSMMGLMLVCIVISYWLGPYVTVVNEYRFYNPSAIFDVLWKATLLFAVAVLLIDDERKLAWFTGAFTVTALYLTYWTNSQYFSLGRFGRIGGPTPPWGGSIYSDENIFAVIFVCGFPFVFLLANVYGSRLIRYLIWTASPFIWHAAFLTASRGAVVALAIMLLFFGIRYEKKLLGFLVMAGFAAAFYYQGGDTLHERTATIDEYQEDGSATGRIDAWKAATNMAMAHPITGVGVASFGQAFPTFSEAEPRIAHNTFFQIWAEWGWIAGGTYLALFGYAISRLIRNGNALRMQQAPDRWSFTYYANESCLFALVGFFTCAIFLSLEKFELMHYLFALTAIVLLLGSNARDTAARPKMATFANSRPTDAS